MGIAIGYALFFIWLFLPMILIAKSPHTAGYKKLLWALGTFSPFAIALLVTKVIQNLALKHPWASEILNSTIGAFVLVMVFLVGGWAVLTLHDGIYMKTNLIRRVKGPFEKGVVK